MPLRNLHTSLDASVSRFADTSVPAAIFQHFEPVPLVRPRHICGRLQIDGAAYPVGPQEETRRRIARVGTISTS